MQVSPPVKELVEAGAVSLVTLLLLSAVIAIGTWGWASSCEAGHPNETVRWTFPGGCELNLAGTWVTVGTTRQTDLIIGRL
jgi:hypothetical protein